MATYKVGEAPWEIANKVSQTSYKVGEAPWEKPAEEPGYFSRVASAYSQTSEDIKSSIKQGADVFQRNVLTPESPITPLRALRATGGLLRTGLRTVGEIAGAAFAPITEAPIIRQGIQKVGESFMKIPGAESVVKSVVDISKQYPEFTKDAEAIINIATLGGGKVVEAPLKAEGSAIAKDIAAGTKAVLKPSEEAVQSKVLSLFQKSVKPTAKKTIGNAEKFQNDTLEALKRISKETPNLNIEDSAGEIITGRAPQSLNELGQALDQTKKKVFEEYDSLAKQAGQSGAQIDAKPIADEVLKVAQNRALQITNPEVIKYAEEWANRLKGLDVLDTETTQAIIQNLNNSLKSFYNNPTYESASRVAIDAGVANNFRQALDKAIEGATGKEYQVLKNQYGSLKAIENDVTRAILRDARKNTKGLLDYTDIFTGGQMVGGLLSLNPAMFTKGAIERGFKEYLKLLNDPNRAIKNIFEQIQKTTRKEFVPESKTFKYIKNPKIGLSVEKINPSVRDNVLKELSQFDGGAMKINGSIDFGNVDANFRLSQLKEKLLKKDNLSNEEIGEAYDLFLKSGIDLAKELPSLKKK